jgi:lycopene beta-cyclase
MTYQYLFLMLGCLVVTLPLEWLLGARVYRRFGVAVLAILPVVVVFSVWDIVGIIRNHWTYNPRYVTGLQLPFSMPIEELVFFIVIPICGLLTYEAVGFVLRRLSARRQASMTGQGTGAGGGHA